jgi:transposase
VLKTETEVKKEMVGIKMYARIQELRSKGYKKQRAAREMEIDIKTVRKYWEMTEDEYVDYQIEAQNRVKVMDSYREFVLERIKEHTEISSSIIYDNLQEEYPEFEPSYRTVRLYVCQLREAQGIPRPAKIRQYAEVEDLPLGFQAQVDMGMRVMTDSYGNRVKVYIFAMVLSTSRHKFAYFQDHPFNTDEFIGHVIK